MALTGFSALNLGRYISFLFALNSACNFLNDLDTPIKHHISDTLGTLGTDREYLTKAAIDHVDRKTKLWGANKKTINTNHINILPRALAVPRTNPHLSQGQTGQNGDFTLELNRHIFAPVLSGVFPQLYCVFASKLPTKQGKTTTTGLIT